MLSLALFPYLILIVWLTELLHRASKPALANFGEQLALSFGVVLTLISLANPTLRSLNLLFSTVTLLIVTQRRLPTRVSLVYLTHIVGLLTLSSAVNRLYPNLSREVWASILLIVMVAEWGFSLLIAISALGTSIMYAYRVLSPWLIDYLGLRAAELKVFAHLHWVVSSICLLIAPNSIPI